MIDRWHVERGIRENFDQIEIEGSCGFLANRFAFGHGDPSILLGFGKKGKQFLVSSSTSFSTSFPLRSLASHSREAKGLKEGALVSHQRSL